MILGLLDEAVASGARLTAACELLGLTVRTVERWRAVDIGDDLRRGPKTKPKNKLSEEEVAWILDVVNWPEYRNLSPKQIVPLLADKGFFIGSERTIYRILKAKGQLKHRETSQPRRRHKPREHVAHGPLEVWSWDITYLKSAVRGEFYYLYLVLDVWSRKIMGWRVETVESMECASDFIRTICDELGIDPAGLVLHSDNGGPMKGSTMLATLYALGVEASFSRPGVSNDNPYSESLFRTMKYRPWYPNRPFASLEEARAWVAAFVEWYNGVHLHSAIGFVTPNDRHEGRDKAIFAARSEVYEKASQLRPERWSRGTRKWDRVETVKLNPATEANHAGEAHADAA